MKSYLTYEILDSIKRFFGSIIDFFTDSLFPRTKMGLLYPFAKSGVVSAQLSIANILFNHYWYWEPKNPEKWIEKGVKQNNPFAIVLKGHFVYITFQYVPIWAIIAQSITGILIKFIKKNMVKTSFCHS